MNIFAVDNCPIQAAKDLCNKHVGKMLIESVQLLSTAADKKGYDVPYKPTHVNHPCAIWTARTPHNYAWVLVHAASLASEFVNRYGKVHKTTYVVPLLDIPELVGDYKLHEDFVLCMPDIYKSNDSVASYRAFYAGEKKFAVWEPKAREPLWWKGVKNEE